MFDQFGKWQLWIERLAHPELADLTFQTRNNFGRLIAS
jgi:hypothetical protein